MLDEAAARTPSPPSAIASPTARPPVPARSARRLFADESGGDKRLPAHPSLPRSTVSAPTAGVDAGGGAGRTAAKEVRRSAARRRTRLIGGDRTATAAATAVDAERGRRTNERE